MGVRLTLCGMIVLGLLAGCASTTPKASWAPRADANIAADQRACRTEADRKYLNNATDYVDGKYGAAAAMASRINQVDGRYGAEDRMREIIFEDCMTAKGWAKL